MTDQPLSVSVVVPTYNRSAKLLRLLNRLSEQAGVDRFEAVVADDGSRDDTAAQVRAQANVVPYDLVLVPSDLNTGAAAARNRGWRRARGSRILFIDDDCVPEPDWLSTMVAGLDVADIVVGRTRPPENQLHLIGPFSSYLDIGHNGSFSTCNIGYRRQVLKIVGGFDEDTFPLMNGEDTDLGLRAVKAGFSDLFLPDALVWHDVHPSHFLDHLRRIRHFEGLVALAALHDEGRQLVGGGWFLRSVDKAVVLAWLAAGVISARPRRPSSWALVGTAAGLYVWQFGRSHYRPRSLGERITSIPLGFVADSWALVVMVRASLRYRTVLL